jgi:hypothetical protein
MSGQLGVALITRKPFAAAFKLDRDDVAFAPVMGTPGFFIDIDADDIHLANFQIRELTSR